MHEVRIDTSWREGMARAYAAGLADGQRGPRYADPTRGEGFDACYWQGFGHGAGACHCPARLRPRWADVRCGTCGKHRAPDGAQ